MEVILPNTPSGQTPLSSTELCWKYLRELDRFSYSPANSNRNYIHFSSRYSDHSHPAVTRGGERSSIKFSLSGHKSAVGLHPVKKKPPANMKELLSHIQHPVKQGVFHRSPLSTRKICPVGYYKISLFKLAPHRDKEKDQQKKMKAGWLGNTVKT